MAEMDEEFGISNLVEEEFGSLSRPRQPVRKLTKNNTVYFSVTVVPYSLKLVLPRFRVTLTNVFSTGW